MTFWDLIEATFDKIKKPLSPKEIWEKAEEIGITKNFETKGKTPWASIGARLYTDINNNEKESKFIQISDRPARFATKLIAENLDLEAFKKEKQNEEYKVEKIQENNKKFNERDLHSLNCFICKN